MNKFSFLPVSQEQLNNSLIQHILDKNVQGVAKLLYQGADVYAKDKEGSNALIIASKQDCLENVFALINSVSQNKQAEYVNSTDNQGYTPLMAAARNGQKENMLELMRAGADVNQEGFFEYASYNNHTKENALIEAIAGGHARNVAVLMAHGANIPQSSLYDDHFTVATNRNDKDVVREMVKGIMETHQNPDDDNWLKFQKSLSHAHQRRDTHPNYDNFIESLDEETVTMLNVFCIKNKELVTDLIIAERNAPGIWGFLPGTYDDKKLKPIPLPNNQNDLPTNILNSFNTQNPVNNLHAPRFQALMQLRNGIEAAPSFANDELAKIKAMHIVYQNDGETLRAALSSKTGLLHLMKNENCSNLATYKDSLETQKDGTPLSRKVMQCDDIILNHIAPLIVSSDTLKVEQLQSLRKLLTPSILNAIAPPRTPASAVTNPEGGNVLASLAPEQSQGAGI